MMKKRFMREHEVLAILALSRTTLNRRLHGDPSRGLPPDPEFPRPRETPWGRRWLSDEVEPYIDRLATPARKAAEA